ncbi:uncharacterized protein LOC130818517 [Amaranthus tricolor]|uniref:uncharacterized protein LOC130818517 n=1 Tax=Amaranthus tricolor TaxID=29722 RepID=UPI002582C7B2|nr:uncharacterized protein LOC130818517 [Amaranthus tricolor]
MDIIRVRTCTMIIALEELKRLLTPLERRPLRVGGEPGCDYIHRLLNIHPDLCREQLRLDRDIFIKLVQYVEYKGWLSDGRYISVAEQIGIALYILAKGASYRTTADKFQHGLATISKYFRKVLQALIMLSTEIIKPFQDLNDVPDKIANDSKYWPFFEHCVGALDGTLIEATISDENLGKYYLVDSGYPNTLGYLSPIKHDDIRYHMPQFRVGPPPTGMLEHFNYRHSSLRTIIERCFGVLKNQWKILKNMPSMEIKYQLAIMVSTFTFHNFIRLRQLGIQISSGVNIEPRSDTNMFNTERKNEMDRIQLNIANDIWASIQREAETS